MTKERTLEQVLRDNAYKSDSPKIMHPTPDGVYLSGSEYILHVMDYDATGLHVYIHPSDRNGDTVDFYYRRHLPKAIRSRHSTNKTGHLFNFRSKYGKENKDGEPVRI